MASRSAAPPPNILYYGDNLDVLREHVKDESCDLAYLDPPFNSNADYNLLFAERDGSRAAAQIKAFTDTWEWNQTSARTFDEIVGRGGKVADALIGLRRFVGESNILAYISMMAPRLVELRRVLRPTGSLYLHCDPTASHYLKMLLDAVFGPESFRNEIIWKRSHAHNDGKQGAKHFGRVTDTILFYGKTQQSTWNRQFTPYDKNYIDRDYRRVDEDGRRYRIGDLRGPGGAAKGNPFYEVMGVKRYWAYSKVKMDALIEAGRVIQTRPGAVPQYKRYLDEMPGVVLQNLWADLPVLNNRSKEVLGYPTQKPEALLERIILASSNEGDVVIDGFCGCGTTIAAAQKLNRRWIGIDITHLAITLIRHRLVSTYGPAVEQTYRVVGEPADMAGAAMLAKDDPYQFQMWALGKVGARPAEMKKGADRGIDGRLYFRDQPGSDPETIVISVKAGERVSSPHVRDLRGVVDREHAAIGVLLSMHPPTREMVKEASSAGFYGSSWGRHPRLQILTVVELLAGVMIDYPAARQTNVTYKAARRAEPAAPKQTDLPLLGRVAKPSPAKTTLRSTREKDSRNAVPTRKAR